MQGNRASWRLLLGLASGLALAATACSGGGGGGGGGSGGSPAPIEFVRNTDGSGQPQPILDVSASGFDNRRVDSVSVVVDPARSDPFMLFYAGSDSSERERIGLVTSADPKFTVLEIDRTVVIDLNSSGTGFDTESVDDPSVVLDTGSATARYKMLYWARTTDSVVDPGRILYSASNDGVNWNDFTPVTGLTPGTDVSFARARIEHPTMILDGGTFKMLFVGIDTVDPNTGKESPGVLGYAESTNGIDWIVKDGSGRTGAAAEPVLRPGVSDRFDGGGLHKASIAIDPTAYPPNRFVTIYEGRDRNGVSSLGLALSEDGTHWRRFGRAAFSASPDTTPLPFDSGEVEHPFLVIDPTLNPDVLGHFKLYYTGKEQGTLFPERIGYADGRVK
jgi:hypothetical protein